MRNETQQNISPHLEIGAILTNKMGKIEWVNHDFTSITGYLLSEVMGKTTEMFQSKNTKPEVVDRIQEALWKLYPTQKKVTNYRKNGDSFLCQMLVYPVFNPTGQHTHYVAFEADEKEIPEDSDIAILQLQPHSPLSNAAGPSPKSLDIFVRLNHLFETEAPYLKPELKLRDIAIELNTNPRCLSQVLSGQTGNSALHFINKFRIREAKKKICNPDFSHYTTYGISQLCGFRNKSTFYKVFREFEGITPKEYIQENQVSTWNVKIQIPVPTVYE